MIFYIDDDMQDQYKCGYGILLSTDRRTGKIQLQWVVIIRAETKPESTKSDTMLALREVQEHEKEINDADRELERSNKIKMLDSLLRPLLEAELPIANDHSIQFDDLRNRQKKLFDIYQTISEPEITIAEERVAFAKAQYEQALSELNEIRRNAPKMQI